MSHQHADHVAVQLHRAVLAAGGLGPAEGGAKMLAGPMFRPLPGLAASAGQDSSVA